MSRKSYVIVGILFLLVALEAAVIIKQNKAIAKLQRSRPFLMTGEVLEPVKLLGVNNERISLGKWGDSEVSLLFIFEQPCTTCTKNLGYWKRLRQVVKGKANVYGIVAGEYREAFGFFDKRKPGFNIYVPYDKAEFTEKVRTRTQLSQTILIKGNKIIALKIGELGHPGFLELVSTIRKHLEGETV